MKSLSILLLCLSVFIPISSSAQSSAKGSISASTTDCSVSNSCVTLAIPNGSGAATITLSGSFSGTLQFEVQTADNAGNAVWTSIGVVPSIGGATATNATAAGVWQANVSGYLGIRVRCSTFSSGPIQVFIQSSVASARSGGSGSGGGVSSVGGTSNQIDVSNGTGNAVIALNPQFTTASYGTCTNTADALTLSPSLPATSLVNGLTVSCKSSAANTTTTPTLNVNSLGAKTIVNSGPTGQAPLVANDILTNMVSTFTYNASSSTWELQNPQQSAGGGLPSGLRSQYLGYGAGNAGVAFQGATYPAVLNGVVADNATDNCTTLGSNSSTGLIGAVYAAGGGVIELPYGTTVTSCDIKLPPQVSIVGHGRNGTQNGGVQAASSTLRFTSTGGAAHIQLLGLSTGSFSGMSKVTDVTLMDTTGSEPFFFITVSADIEHVALIGKAANNSAVNDGFLLGDIVTHTCVWGSTASAICDYGPVILNDIYLSKIRTQVIFGDDANDVHIDNWNAAADCGDGVNGTTGYAFLFQATSGHANYGNTIGPHVSIEQGPALGDTTYYKGSVGTGATSYALYNDINIIVSDAGATYRATNHTVYLNSDTSTNNNIIIRGQQWTAPFGPFFDTHNSLSNDLYDNTNDVTYRYKIATTHIGDASNPNYWAWLTDITWATYTVAGLPSTHPSTMLAWVSDGNSSSDCTVGGGTTQVMCKYANGAWSAVGNNGVSSVSGTANQITVSSGTTNAVAALSPQFSSAEYGACTNTADALTVTPAVAPTSLVSGLKVYCKSSAANTTTTPTLNVNSLGAKTIVKAGPSGQVALVANDIRSNMVAVFVYNATSTTWELQNPQQTSMSLPTGLSGETLGYGSGNSGVAYQGVTYPAVLKGVVADNATDNCTVLGSSSTTGLIGAVYAAGGGVIELPYGTTVTSCDIQLPPGVRLVGDGRDGTQNGSSVVAPSSIRFTSTAGTAHIQITGIATGTKSGYSSVEDLSLIDTSGGEEFFFITTPAVIKNVSLHGKAATTSAVNDGFVFGNTANSCVWGSVASGVCDYGPFILDNIYLDNIRTQVIFGNDANDVHIDNWNAAATCGDGSTGAAGYAFLFQGTSGHSNYGNTIGPHVAIEQGEAAGNNTHYKGVVGTGATASMQYNDINIIVSDAGTTYRASNHTVYLNSTSATNNHITIRGQQWSAPFGPFSDTHSSLSNDFYDNTNDISYLFKLDTTHIGDLNNNNAWAWLDDITWATYTVSGLPSTHPSAVSLFVSDGASTTDCVTGGGSNRVPCYYNGSAWQAFGAPNPPTTLTLTGINSTGLLGASDTTVLAAPSANMCVSLDVSLVQATAGSGCTGSGTGAVQLVWGYKDAASAQTMTTSATPLVTGWVLGAGGSVANAVTYHTPLSGASVRNYTGYAHHFFSIASGTALVVRGNMSVALGACSVFPTWTVKAQVLSAYPC